MQVQVDREDLDWLFNVCDNLLDEEWESSGQGRCFDDEAFDDFKKTDTHLDELRKKYAK